MEEFASVLFLIFFASVKFMFSAPLAILQYKLPYWEAVLYLTIGGWAGVFVFAYMNTHLKAWINRIEERFLSNIHYFNSKKKFTFKNRSIIKLKTKYGLPGLVVFTPIFISIPFGAFIAQHYYPGRRTIILLLSSVLFWAMSLNALYVFVF